MHAESSRNEPGTFQIGNIVDDPDFHQWETTLKKCESLHSLGSECNTVRANKKVMRWRAINALRCRQVMREGNVDEFISTVSTAAQYGVIDVVYFLLRNNVGFIK